MKDRIETETIRRVAITYAEIEVAIIEFVAKRSDGSIKESDSIVVMFEVDSHDERLIGAHVEATISGQ